MPKFYKQNSKKVDPRYFLNENQEEQSQIDETIQGDCEVVETTVRGKSWTAKWVEGDLKGPAVRSSDSEEDACQKAKKAFDQQRSGDGIVNKLRDLFRRKD